MDLYKWPDGTLVTYHTDLTGCPAELSPAVAVAGIDQAVAEWPKVCGVQTAKVTDPSQARVLIRFQDIDPSGVELGLTDLPVDGQANERHLMRLDDVAAYGGWTPLKLYQTAVHEFGHAIGLGHSPPGVVAIMSPVLNQSLSGPQPWDAGEAQARYGPPSMPSAGATGPATPPAAGAAPVPEPGASTPPAGVSLSFEAVSYTVPGVGTFTLTATFKPLT